jgi:hypothetical protein
MKERENMSSKIEDALRRSLVGASSAARHISDDKVSEIVSKLSKESLERLHKILKGS